MSFRSPETFAVETEQLPSWNRACTSRPVITLTRKVSYWPRGELKETALGQDLRGVLGFAKSRTREDNKEVSLDPTVGLAAA